MNYRKLAFSCYGSFCACCGHGIREILEVAHIDGNRNNNDARNLVILCPTCHKMLDLDLISNDIVIAMRDRKREVKWAKRMKEAGMKAARTRKRSLAAVQAVATRRLRQADATEATGGGAAEAALNSAAARRP